MTARTDGLPKKRQIRRWDVSVNPEDIAAATPENSSHCMIARAVARAVGCPERFVSVDLQLIEFSDPARHLRLTYLTPELAQRSLLDFDEGHPVEPFSMRLQNPVQVRPSNLGRPAETRPPARPSEITALRRREQHKKDLVAKEKDGTLTRAEKSALTRIRSTDKLGGPVVSVAPPRQGKHVIPPAPSDNARTTRIEGGPAIAPSARNRTLSNRLGQRRRYGLRAAARR